MSKTVAWNKDAHLCEATGRVYISTAVLFRLMRNKLILELKKLLWPFVFGDLKESPPGFGPLLHRLRPFTPRWLRFCTDLSRELSEDGNLQNAAPN